MAEEKMQHNTDCTEQGHNKHLCFLMYEGIHLSHPEDYKKIVQNAQFRCQNCGRTAANSNDLCHPIAL